jgi:hypothetical protein
MANLNHSTLTDPKIHEPKGASTATAGYVYIADGAGSGSWGTPAGSKQLEVLVQSASDFPAAVSDVITLAADTVYVIDGDINIGNDRFVMSSNSQIFGLGSGVSTITTTTTGNVFTSSSSFTLKGFAITASSGTMFSCTGGSTESAYLKEFTVNACSSMGIFSAWYSLFWDKGAVVSCTTGLTFSGACAILILDLVEFITGYTTAIDLNSSTFNTCSFNRCGFGYASATNHIILAANSANINSGKEGRIISCTFNSGATNIVTNSDVGDIRWEYLFNLNLPNSTKNAQGYMHTTTTTTISGGDGDSGNPKIVNGGTNWITAHDDQFTVTNAGRFTYDGVTVAEFLIMCAVSGTTASGTQTINHYIAKNGTAITASKTQREYTSTAVGSPAPCTSIVTLANGDYVELYLENITGTNNWDSYILNMTISEVI